MTELEYQKGWYSRISILWVLKITKLTDYSKFDYNFWSWSINFMSLFPVIPCAQESAFALKSTCKWLSN